MLWLILTITQCKAAAHYQRRIRIRSQVQHHLHEMRNSWWMTKAQEIQEHANNIRAFSEALNSVFGTIRRSFCHVKDSSGALLIKERDGILSRWAEHFNTLLNKRNPSHTSFLDSLPTLPPITCLDNTPTLTEVRSAISGLLIDHWIIMFLLKGAHELQAAVRIGLTAISFANILQYGSY